MLVPRPDTETLVETAIEILFAKDSGPKRVLEMGVGSGAIIVSVASACPGHTFFGCDISPAALAMAQENAHNLTQTPVHFFQGSWLDAVGGDGQFDLILSNPPYIPRSDIQQLEPEVRDHEPLLALDGGPDGLDAFRAILVRAGDHLVSGGQMLLEMGFDQGDGLAALAGRYPWVRNLKFKKDLAGHNRLAILKK